MSRRERLEARAERRREWAASREAKTAVVAREAEHYRGDYAFNTQPGHIPARARLIARQERAFGDMQMAEHHRTAADGIERQLDRSIFSDDENATERLEERAARIDEAADRMVAINRAWRKLPGDDKAAKLAQLLSQGDMTKGEAMECGKTFALCHWQRQPFAPYEISNARARARRDRERTKAIEKQAERTAQAEAAGGATCTLHGPVPEHQSACITFAEYPGREIVAALKAAGFWWVRPSWHGSAANIPDRVRAMLPDDGVCPDGPACPDPECIAAREAQQEGATK